MQNEYVKKCDEVNLYIIRIYEKKKRYKLIYINDVM